MGREVEPRSDISLRARFETRFENWARLAIEFRRAVLGIALAPALLLALALPNLAIENSDRSYLKDSDPYLVAYDEFIEQFGNENRFVVALQPN